MGILIWEVSPDTSPNSNTCTSPLYFTCTYFIRYYHNINTLAFTSLTYNNVLPWYAMRQLCVQKLAEIETALWHKVMNHLNLYDFGTFRCGTAPLLELTHISLYKIVIEFIVSITMYLRKFRPMAYLLTPQFVRHCKVLNLPGHDSSHGTRHRQRVWGWSSDTALFGKCDNLLIFRGYTVGLWPIFSFKLC